MINNTMYIMGQFINTIVNIVLFSSIPFLWYILSKKRFKGVFKYLGLNSTDKQNYFQAFKMTSLAYVFSISIIVILKLTQEGMYLHPLNGSWNRGFIVRVISLILFSIQTGIGEEIFFRGFLGKRLIHKFGFLKGNVLQAIIFMTPHILTFGKSPTLEAILGVINSAIIGFTFGYIMDKKSNGSILPVIICHGIVNVISAILINII